MSKRGTTPHGCPTSHGRHILLSSFFEDAYRPLRLRKHAQPVRETSIYRWLIRKLATTLGREPYVADLCDSLRQRLRIGLDQNAAHKASTRLNSLWKYAAALGLAGEYKPSPNWGCKKAEPVGEPGTVAHFFQTVYKPQTQRGSSRFHVLNYLAMLRKLPICFKRDLLLSELSAATLAEFLAWCEETGLAPGRVKCMRSCLLAIWRYAHDSHLAAPVAGVRRMKIPHEEPDAWSLRELARIIEAARQLKAEPINGIPANDFWTAMLLVGWYTGLRRRALFAIEPKNVDLASGWIYVPAKAMKNSLGKRFRIGPDAIEAVRAIFDRSRRFLFAAVGGELSQCVRRDFPKILRAAEVEGSCLQTCHFHKLRRTTATHVAAAAGLAAASALLGHGSPELLKRYIDRRYIVGNDATDFLPTIRGSNDTKA